MGDLRLTRLVYARRGIPWLAIGIVATPALALMACAFVFAERPVGWSLLRSGLLIWAATAAFLLDDPPAPVVHATPRSPSWWHGSRFLGALPLVALPIVAASIWALDQPDAYVLQVSVQAVAAWLIVLACAALASRLGRYAPGDLVASAAILVILFLLAHPMRVGEVLLLPGPGDPRWPESTMLWLLFGTAAMAAIAIAGWWARSPRPAR